MPVALALVRHGPIISFKPPIDPIPVVYGFILVWILQSFVGASLAEFVSAYPTEGGMYHWIAAIAPKRYNSLLSFATGWSTVFGCESGSFLLDAGNHLLIVFRDLHNRFHKLDLFHHSNGPDRALP